MMTRRTVWASLFVWALALWVSPVSANAAQSSYVTAQLFIEGLAVEAVPALTAQGVPRAERVTRSLVSLCHTFYEPLCRQCVLRRYQPTASSSSTEEYTANFQDSTYLPTCHRF